MIISILTVIFCVLYTVFLLWCHSYWREQEEFGDIYKFNVPVTVVVPMRNEEDNVEGLLESLCGQTYSNFDVILVDDHSDDDTISNAQKWIDSNARLKVTCLSSTGNSKKEAITQAIDNTFAQLIITTDADCRMHEEWIAILVAQYMRRASYLISAPVIMKSGESDLGKIQAAEYAGLTAIGAAAIKAGKPMFCSGANLAFSRSSFLAVGGYGGSRSKSGDDTQLMRKISERWPHKISFLKDYRATVETATSSDHLHLFQQRRRWASKIPFTLSPFTVSIALLAWIFHLLLLIQLYNVLNGSGLIVLLIAVVIKLRAEIVLVSDAMRFMKQKFPLGLIIAVQPFYALYIVLIGAIAPLTKFRWKGRVSR